MTKRKTLQQDVAESMATDGGAPTPATGAPPPSGTRVVTDADLAADREFVASLDALGNGPADMPEPEATEEPEPVDYATTDAPPTEATDSVPVRGGVNALVTRLLADPGLSYEAIVARVVAAFPDAQTSARSVASTASVLRRKGTQVPMRRGPQA